MTNPNSSIIIYQSETGRRRPKVDVRFEGETVWLTQKLMGDLFNVGTNTINYHLKEIFKSSELSEKSVIRKFRITANDNKSYNTSFYNLKAIIAVGYRVNSDKATKFRIWATDILEEYIIKGFTMDDERLKNLGGGGYWKELIARIRDIRTSEKAFYRQILEIYATSIDYDPRSSTSVKFFQTVQNKIHYAIHGKTAAETIYTRADAKKEFMGLTTFSGTKPQLKDTFIAKNYLDEKELRALGQLVSGYLDFAQRQAEREIPMKMKDWVIHLDNILTSTGEKLLLDAGKISHDLAVKKAKTEYKKYQQKTLSNVEKDYLDIITSINKTIIDKKTE